MASSPFSTCYIVVLLELMLWVGTFFIITQRSQANCNEADNEIICQLVTGGYANYMACQPCTLWPLLLVFVLSYSKPTGQMTLCLHAVKYSEGLLLIQQKSTWTTLYVRRWSWRFTLYCIILKCFSARCKTGALLKVFNHSLLTPGLMDCMKS